MQVTASGGDISACAPEGQKPEDDLGTILDSMFGAAPSDETESPDDFAALLQAMFAGAAAVSTPAPNLLPVVQGQVATDAVTELVAGPVGLDSVIGETMDLGIVATPKEAESTDPTLDFRAEWEKFLSAVPTEVLTEFQESIASIRPDATSPEPVPQDLSDLISPQLVGAADPNTDNSALRIEHLIFRDFIELESIDASSIEPSPELPKPAHAERSENPSTGAIEPAITAHVVSEVPKDDKKDPSSDAPKEEHHDSTPKSDVTAQLAPAASVLNPASPSTPTHGPRVAAEPGAIRHFAVEQIVKGVSTHSSEGVTRVEAQIDPPELGRMSIELSRTAEGLSAKITADDPAVLALLDQQVREVQQALEAAGVPLLSLQLGLGMDSSSSREERPEQDESGISQPIGRSSSAVRTAPRREIDTKA
jgi:flagellar hook-length control protein FliK